MQHIGPGRWRIQNGKVTRAEAIAPYPANKTQDEPSPVERVLREEVGESSDSESGRFKVHVVE